MFLENSPHVFHGSLEYPTMANERISEIKGLTFLLDLVKMWLGILL